MNNKDLPIFSCYDFPRVRILIDYRPALRQRTGAGEYADRLAKALARQAAGTDTLTLFSSSWKDRLPEDAVPGAGRVDARVPVRLLNAAWHRLEWPPVEWFAGPMDVLQSMHPLLIPTRGFPRGSMRGGNRGPARFVTIHDLYFLDHPEQTSREIRRDYPGLAGDHARRADGVVVPSEYTRQQVAARLDVAEERLIVCSPGAPEWPRRAEPGTAGPILFVGTIEPRKNIPGLLKAYAQLRERMPAAPPLVVAGSGAFVTLSRTPPKEDGVEWLGYVTDERLQALYREASMLVMPSFEEGFGLPVLHAMTLGVPVVAARRGSLPEVLGGAGLLVDPEEAADIAAAMERVLGDAELRTHMADAGVTRAKDYRWDTAARRLYAAYHHALTHPRSTA